MVTIRRAEVKDRERVAALWRLAGIEEADEDEWQAITQGPSTCLLVAMEDRQVAGTVVVSFDGWRAFLYHVAVHPSYRGRGLARSLMREAEDRIAMMGARRLYALIDARNTPGIGLCASMGFEPEGDMAFVKELAGVQQRPLALV
jgi:ribosomal protein S18 acetylase RimI-like enzyme